MEFFLETAAPVASISKLSRFSALMVTLLAFFTTLVTFALTSWDTMETPTAAATDTGFSLLVVVPVLPFLASFFAFAALAALFSVVSVEPLSTECSEVFTSAAARTLLERLVSESVFLSPVAPSFLSMASFTLLLEELLFPELLFFLNALPFKISSIVAPYLLL